MSEEDFKKISEHLTIISEWQKIHEINEVERANLLPVAVKTAVEIQINGNLRDLKQQQNEIKEHLTKQDSSQNEILGHISEIRDEQKLVRRELSNLKVATQPAVESITVLVAIRKFLLWVATPFAIIWAIIQYLINK